MTAFRFSAGLSPLLILLLVSCASPYRVLHGDRATAVLPASAEELAAEGFGAAVLRDRDTRRLLLAVLNPPADSARSGAIEWKVREGSIRRRGLAQSWNLVLLDRPGGEKGPGLTPELAAEILASQLYPSLVYGREGELRAVVYQSGGVRSRPRFLSDGSLLLEFGRRSIERSEIKYSFELF